MEITIGILERWLSAPIEMETLEFKEAKQQYDSEKLMRYCVAIANERGGYLVLGVTNEKPRHIIGTRAFATAEAIDKLKFGISQKLNIRVEVTEINHPEGRVLVIEIPSRPQGQPMHYEGAYLMRVGEHLVPMTPDQLKRIFDEGQIAWLDQVALDKLSADQVIDLLDTQTYFDLLGQPYPTTQENVLKYLQKAHLLDQTPEGWHIFNATALLLAKKIAPFSFELRSRMPRVIIYDGTNKFITKNDIPGTRGYAVGFEGLVNFIYDAAPQNRFIEQTTRKETKMFPKQALRELIANAMVHQDFTMTGTSLMVELFTDRIEISNPGLPSIRTERFIDEYDARNEKLATLFRHLKICEQKGSGIDKVIDLAEKDQLPAPEFRIDTRRTIVVMYAHKDFVKMRKSDRVRACYQHCCLMRINNEYMTNQSLRQRFGVGEDKMATISLIIRDTKDEGLIKLDDSETKSPRYARYLPFWA